MPSKTTSSKIFGLSLCSGGAGLELGLKLVFGDAYRTQCYVEHEAYAAAVLAARIKDKALDDAPIWDDIKTFDPEPWRGKISLISGGWPCQPFSSAGRRKGKDDPRHLWPWIASILGTVRPALAFFENVPGHLHLGFREVHEELQALGYTVAAGLFSAAECGASHKRERLFILAHRTGGGEGAVQQPGQGRGSEPKGGALADSTNKSRGSKSEFKSGEQPRILGQSIEELGDSHEVSGKGGSASGLKEQEGSEVGRDPLADSSGQRLQGGQQRSSLPGGGPGGETYGTARKFRDPYAELPFFPPGPSDREGWEFVLGGWPELAPAVGNSQGDDKQGDRHESRGGEVPARGSGIEENGEEKAQPAVRLLADELADRMGERTGQLRLIGNGVVPITAARAFVTLARALGLGG